MDINLKARFIQAVRSKIDEAVSVYNITAFTSDTVEVRLDVKGRVAGWAGRRGGDYFLRFNPEAIVNYTNDMIENTIPHEVAHLVCYARRELGSHHDAGWKKVCRTLGGDDSRTHDMVLTPAKVKQIVRHNYNIHGKMVVIGPKHHNWIQAGKKNYTYNHPTRGTVDILPSMYVDSTVVRPSGSVPTQQAASAPAAPTPAPAAGASKREIAQAIYVANKHLTRGEVIKMFVAQAGMTVAGASTYYQNFKKAGL